MRVLTGVLTVLLLVCVSGIAYAPPQPGSGTKKAKWVSPAGAGEKFEKIVSGNVVVFYKEGWKDVAEKTAEMMSRVLDDTLKKASMEYTGRCEITLRPMAPGDIEDMMSLPLPDARANLIRFPVAVPRGGADTFSLEDLKTRRGLLTASKFAISFQVQAILKKASANNLCWFTQGFSTYLLVKAASEMAGDDWWKLVQLSLADKMLEHYRDKLLNWGTFKRDSSNQTYTVACMQMFLEIEKKFGADAIRKIGEGYVEAERHDRDSLVKIISDAIGEDFIEFLKNYESPGKYPSLGVMIDPAYDGEGVKVIDIQAGTAAAEAGVKAEDVIIKAEGRDINDIEALKEVIDEVGVGGKLHLVIKRGGEELELTAVLKERAFQFPPPPPAGPAPPAPPHKGFTESPKKAALLAAGFSKAQIELMFKYFEPAAPGDAARIEADTKKRVEAFLKEAGFTAPQIKILLDSFKLDSETAGSLPQVDGNGGQPDDEGKSAVEMLVARGCQKAMAKGMVQMLKRRGKTEEEIKEMIRKGKIKLPKPRKTPRQP